MRISNNINISEKSFEIHLQNNKEIINLYCRSNLFSKSLLTCSEKRFKYLNLMIIFLLFYFAQAQEIAEINLIDIGSYITFDVRYKENTIFKIVTNFQKFIEPEIFQNANTTSYVFRDLYDTKTGSAHVTRLSESDFSFEFKSEKEAVWEDTIVTNCFIPSHDAYTWGGSTAFKKVIRVFLYFLIKNQS